MSGRRIGILGGTFDPVHVGHLIVAAEARASLQLDELVFMPAGKPPHKPRHVPASVEDRVAMIAAAIDGEPCTRLDSIDLERPGPQELAIDDGRVRVPLRPFEIRTFLATL